VDSHAHLDLEEFASELPEVLARARQAGVATIGNVFLGPTAYAAGKSLFKDRPEVFFLLGAHPTDAASFDESTRGAMTAAFRDDPRLKAVGEIGLDYYWKDVEPAVQIKTFRSQLAMARDLDKPVVIHCREADHDALPILDDEGFAGRPLLWHCFGGGPDMAEKLLSRGWLISIPGPVTYPKNEALREAVRTIPLERLVLETDCPYLSPQAWRGKRNEPSYLGFTNLAVAEAKGLDPAQTWLATAENAKTFFNL
jgi:TatD DNase family protein